MFITILLLCTVCFFSCEGAPPELYESEFSFYTFVNKEMNITDEKLSLYVRVHDPDGFDDISSFYLIHDEEELFWTLEGPQWHAKTVSDQIWIGSGLFTMPEGEAFPTGEYRILFTDLAGRRGEKRVYFNEKDVNPINWVPPGIEVKEGVITLPRTETEYPAELLVYDGAGNYMGNVYFENGTIGVQEKLVPKGLYKDYYRYYMQFQLERNHCLIFGPFFL